MLRHEFHFFLVAAFEGQQSDTADGRVSQLPPKIQFLFVEAHKVVPASELNGRVKRRESLHDNLALDIAPARAAGHLSKQLERALAGPEIGLVQRKIGVND